MKEAICFLPTLPSMGEWSINTRFAFSQHWGLKNISFGLLPEAICNLHSCYKFCICVTSFALVLKIKELHSFLSQSELSNFFVYIIMPKIKLIFVNYG